MLIVDTSLRLQDVESGVSVAWTKLRQSWDNGVALPVMFRTMRSNNGNAVP